MYILTYLSSKNAKQISVCIKSFDELAHYCESNDIKNFNVTYVPTCSELDV